MGHMVWLLEMSLKAATVVAAMICPFVGRIAMGSKKLVGILRVGGSGGGGGGGGGGVRGGGLERDLL